MLDVLLEHEAYSDVVRESQEIVELALKAMLREIGIEPPKFHDVGPFLVESREKFPPEVQNSIARLAEISGYLRKERELSFYGDIDFVPTERYSRGDAERAMQDAAFVVEIAGQEITRERA
jgi:HEPN domain-containing protein